jgi:hypothetical protein
VNSGGGRAIGDDIGSFFAPVGEPIVITPVELGRMPRYDTVIVRLPEDGRSERRLIELYQQEPFRPAALLLWGAKAETKVRDILTGLESQFMTVVPGCLFESELSFAEFQALLKPRREIDATPAIADADVRQLGLIFRIDMPSLPVGMPLSLDIEGGYDHGVFLGHMLQVAAEGAVA